MGKEVLRIFRATLSEMQLPITEWPALVPILQSALNNSQSPQRGNRAPITIFLGQKPSTPNSVFKTPSSGKLVTLTAAAQERIQNLDNTKIILEHLHPLIEKDLHMMRNKQRVQTSKGKPANFDEGDYVLVAKDDVSKGEKLSLKRRGPRRVLKAQSEWIYEVEDLRNNLKECIHASRLRLYSDANLNQEAIMPHILYSETGMPVSRLMKLEKIGNKIMVHVRWKGLPASDDTLEPIAHVYHDVPQMLTKLLKRQNIDKQLANDAKSQPHL